jgi:hypothetical protein
MDANSLTDDVLTENEIQNKGSNATQVPVDHEIDQSHKTFEIMSETNAYLDLIQKTQANLLSKTLEKVLLSPPDNSNINLPKPSAFVFPLSLSDSVNPEILRLISKEADQFLPIITDFESNTESINQWKLFLQKLNDSSHEILKNYHNFLLSYESVLSFGVRKQVPVPTNQVSSHYFCFTLFFF